ncbi:hypothetical protein N7510_005583 [Penicillium lagena]|uniref:uncharacterized protein n=1 Tax=Penicillium lagena TaxID=94218 RepID=UPI00253F8B24|nr:uncharacterized protein N7510_005583 [Penicillium lagena]KAJ5612389.1 hypothetical protein N7510_005583 [Penicillium lagena]
MAKSVRASVSKRNKAALRKKVFGPVVDARTERLSAKLQEIAAQPRPEREKTDGSFTASMLMDYALISVLTTEEDQDAAATTKDSQNDEEMDIDTTSKDTKSKSKSGRVQKRNRRARPSIVFQKYSSKKGSKK